MQYGNNMHNIAKNINGSLYSNFSNNVTELLKGGLIDGIDIIVHIFNPKKRNFYNLEKMWSELLPKERLTI